jgi:hypothetical protein
MDDGACFHGHRQCLLDLEGLSTYETTLITDALGALPPLD